METFEFLWRLSDARIVEAIRRAESQTSGEIRVYISDSEVDDPLLAARARFTGMGMAQTRERNGVLIFVAPKSQTFAVIGDEGVHARCGEAFWQSVSEEMRRHFTDDAMTDGIVQAISTAGELLGRHFPRLDDDQNELPDHVERGR